MSFSCIIYSKARIFSTIRTELFDEEKFGQGKFCSIEPASTFRDLPIMLKVSPSGQGLLTWSKVLDFVSATMITIKFPKAMVWYHAARTTAFIVDGAFKNGLRFCPNYFSRSK